MGTGVARSAGQLGDYLPALYNIQRDLLMIFVTAATLPCMWDQIQYTLIQPMPTSTRPLGCQVWTGKRGLPPSGVVSDARQLTFDNIIPEGLGGGKEDTLVGLAPELGTILCLCVSCHLHDSALEHALSSLNPF